MPFLAGVSQCSGLHLFQDEGNFPIAPICIKVSQDMEALQSFWLSL
ncbi:hypothetical protein T4D_4761 [Trichinella pseudospiralis]|uniref:Uncharacterized protein n=1 Tax=Trichinella pseudospiralis TaxID=6337 RepID=A0A0V1F2E0_TRIPS|nr:hypothetical protein T4D_4761 [Trichinella pseudospiralis]